MQLKEFKNFLAEVESGNNYNANNGIAFGKYQFTKERINEIANDLGLNKPTIYEFLNSPELQEIFIDYQIQDLKRFIEQNNLNKVIGSYVTGSGNYPMEARVNIYGLLAGGHIGGKNGLKSYVLYGQDKKDVNGTYISDYVARFSNLMKTKKKFLQMFCWSY